MKPSEAIPGPAYRIITSRHIIRGLEPKDAAMLGVALEESLKHLLPWIPWASKEPLILQERVELLRKWRGNFDLGIDFEYGIFNSAETMVLGVTRLSTTQCQEAREIGYWIHKDHINQGYATESSAALIRVSFEIDHGGRVEIHCDLRNIRSASVPKKLGIIHEDTSHNLVNDVHGNLRNSMIWTLFQENYLSSLAAQADIQTFDVIGRRII
jgi:RimJ/RimL family protein N-acetyltransferase